MGGEIARYLGGLERLLEIEQNLVRETMGERKAAIIKDGIRELRAQARPNGRDPGAVCGFEVHVRITGGKWSRPL